MKRLLSALAGRPDSEGTAPDAIALIVLFLFVGAVSWGAATIGTLVALWRVGAL